MDSWLTQLKTMLKTDEGLKLQAYYDSLGIYTLGYGHNLNAPITEGAANHILDDDVAQALKDLTVLYSNFINLTDNRKIVLLNMMFNLGAERLAGFKLMFAALNKGDYQEAANQMLSSEWATQIKDRAQRLAALMQVG